MIHENETEIFDNENGQFANDIKYTIYNDKDPNKDPNTIVVFFFCPQFDGNPSAEVEENGTILVASFGIPKIEEKDFEQPTSTMTFSETLARLAEIAAFKNQRTESVQMIRQRLQLPFQIEEELKEVTPVTLHAHHFLKVVGKRFQKKTIQTAEFENRFAISDLVITAGKIVAQTKIV